MSTQIITGLASQAGHWYSADGAPAYEIPAKNGNLRAVTLRDARKFNLFPSVTGILNCAAKPGLERWKIEQAVLSALTLPRIDGENEQSFAARALEDSKEQARSAALLGTMLHEQIERSFSGACEPDWLDFVQPVRDWLANQFGAVDWCAERSFAHPLGYGGKVDLFARSPAVVIDFKSKDFDDPEAVKAYDEHGIQLAAYAHGLGLEGAERWNIFVSTRVPGLIKPVKWEPSTLERHWGMFHSLTRYWQIDKGYAPVANQEAA